jgi:hypothetical protein
MQLKAELEMLVERLKVRIVSRGCWLMEGTGHQSVSACAGEPENAHQDVDEFDDERAETVKVLATAFRGAGKGPEAVDLGAGGPKG